MHYVYPVIQCGMTDPDVIARLDAATGHQGKTQIEVKPLPWRTLYRWRLTKQAHALGWMPDALPADGRAPSSTDRRRHQRGHEK